MIDSSTKPARSTKWIRAGPLRLFTSDTCCRRAEISGTKQLRGCI